MAKLLAYSFPGNIRELENIVEAAVYTSPGPVILANDILLREVHDADPVEEVAVENFWESVARPLSERRITTHATARPGCGGTE
jgi:DNA-binding NtrC family response regulator